MKRAACLFLTLWTAGFLTVPLAASAENTPANSAQNPKTPAAAAKTVPAPPPPPIDPAIAVQKANAYFSSNSTMIGDFVQIGGDGRRSEGKIYVQRPGKLRFEYALPATLEIVADGMSVAVVDRKLGTKDVYFISQTPLKFLLKDQIDLSRDAQVVNVTSDPTTVSILIEDKQTFGGTSFIKLMFDPVKFTLKQWQITDPQGYETLVSLFNVDLTKKPDPWLFGLAPPPAEHPVNAN